MLLGFYILAIKHLSWLTFYIYFLSLELLFQIGMTLSRMRLYTSLCTVECDVQYFIFTSIVILVLESVSFAVLVQYFNELSREPVLPMTINENPSIVTLPAYTPRLEEEEDAPPRYSICIS